MGRLSAKNIALIVGCIVCFCMLMQGWDELVSFLGILVTAIVPLLLGTAIAYVISIPTQFFGRHFLPNSTSKFVAAIRRPVSLAITVVLVLTVLILSSSVLIPALIETVTMVQRNGQAFLEDVIQLPILKPVRGFIHDFLNGDFIQSLKSMDISSVLDGLFGGTVGSITTRLFTVVSMIMTGFFGMLFSFILLTDTTEVGNKIMGAASMYLGPKRTARLALVMGVADASFHNFIVRQFVEALILGTVGTLVLLAGGFPYALGTGVLLGLAALIPIVGYPVGMLMGAFMVAIYNVWLALLFIVCVAVTQMLEATFVLPHVGDPRTVLPPVWTTVGVTIGGGVAGFVGMLVSIPIASTIYQLIVKDVRRREEALGYGTTKPEDVCSHDSPLREAELAEGLVDNDGDGVGEVE